MTSRRLAVMRRQDRRGAPCAREHGFQYPTADAFAVAGGMDVQLGELEGIVEPRAGISSADLLAERTCHHVVPPVAWPAVVAVTEADDAVVGVTRQHPDEA